MPAPPLTPTPATASVDRASVLAAARDGRSWEAISCAVGYLAAHAGDAGVRFVLARCLADVGLPAAAAAQLGALPEAASEAREVAALSDRLPAESSAVVGYDQRVARVDAALAALGAQACGLEAAVCAWREQEREWMQERAADGNVVRWPSGNADPAAWIGLRDAVGDARAAARTFTRSAHADGSAPLIIDRVRTPWLLLAVLAATPVRPGGFRRRVRIVEREPAVLFGALAMADLEEALNGRAVDLHSGPDAVAELERAMVASPGLSSVGGVVCGPGDAPTPGVAEAVSRAAAHLRIEEDRLRARVENKLRGRDTAYWASRYRRALEPGSTEPLRVLVVTCLYTTYVRHAAADLAAAFRALGYKVELLIEPDRSSMFSPSACLEPLDRFDPDLVVMINYTRSTVPTPIPEGVPFVCWLQDQMPHLYSEGCGPAHGELDFVIGYTRRLLFDRFGYPPERAMFTPVVASAEKFRPEPVSDGLRERLACDIAYVSNQSQTPERFHAQILEEAGDETNRAIIDAMFPLIRDAVAVMATEPMLPPLRARLAEVIRRVSGADAGEQQLDRFIMQYVYRVGELFARHEMLHWAAGVCARRGWRLKLFGAGWEDHPTLGAFAAGPLGHGDELRASYAAAGVHLHASVSNLVHQRVLECALSGGVTLCRSLWDIRPGAAGALRRLGIRPEDSDAAEGDRIGFSPQSRATLAEAVSGWRRLGWADGLVGADGWVWCDRGALGSLWDRDTLDDSDWWCHRALFGELDRFTFGDAAGLEARVERVLSDPGERAAMNAMVAERARRDFSSASLAARIVELVAGSLSGDGTRPATPR